MRWFVGAVTVAMGAWCPAQEFIGPFSFYDVESGMVSLLPDLDRPAGSQVWEFRVRGRNGFMRMLYEIHSRENYEYEVVWGVDEDLLRVKTLPFYVTSGGRTPFETKLLHALQAVGMTYRKEGGIYNLIPRPIPLPQDGLGPLEPPNRGELSLDVLARSLCEQGRGYRVENVNGSPVWLRAPFISFETLLWILRELDPGIAVSVVGGGVVVRARGPVDRP